MDKPCSTKGFTILEMLLIVMILSSIYALIPRVSKISINQHLFVFDYFEVQSKAIATTERQELISDGKVINFNERGNVRKAQTLEIYGVTFISHLGGGRLVKE